MRVYGLKTCDTCRKAVRELIAAGHAPDVLDVRADGVPEDVLRAALSRIGAGVLNTRSATWRGLDAGERKAAPVVVLRRHPAVMKRPLIVEGDRLTVGWDREARAQWLGSEA